MGRRSDETDSSLSSPLPSGERSDCEAIRVRGFRQTRGYEPPHPGPLPHGEREKKGYKKGRAFSPAFCVSMSRDQLCWIAESIQFPRGARRKVHSSVASIGLAEPST